MVKSYTLPFQKYTIRGRKSISARFWDRTKNGCDKNTYKISIKKTDGRKVFGRIKLYECIKNCNS